jgi:UDP-glucose 4-epimerase
MLRHDVRRLVFSSSATVYGTPSSNPIAEEARLGPLNPYGRTKLAIEQIIDDLVVAEPAFAAISLRYFNPVGAHKSGLIGEKPEGVPNNLFPYIAQTAAGIRDRLRVFGGDYPTPDGSGIRDYIHVWDLARAHLSALVDFDHVFKRAGQPIDRYLVINLGTGQGVTVRELVAAFEKVSGKTIAKGEYPPRPGDVAGAFANADTAKRLLGWQAELSIEQGIADALKWGELRRSILKFN